MGHLGEYRPRRATSGHAVPAYIGNECSPAGASQQLAGNVSKWPVSWRARGRLKIKGRRAGYPHRKLGRARAVRRKETAGLGLQTVRADIIDGGDWTARAPNSGRPCMTDVRTITFFQCRVASDGLRRKGEAISTLYILPQERTPNLGVEMIERELGFERA